MRSVLRRREFVKSLAFGGLGLLAAAACAPSAPSAGQAPATVAPAVTAPTTAPATAQSAAQPAPPTAAASTAQGTPAAAAGAAPAPKGKRLVFGSPRQLYEGNNHARSGDPIGSAGYEFLLGIDMTTGMFVPQLAERYQVEPNGKDYRFFLRKGIPFHNNMGEMTADDVVFSYDQVMAQGQTNNAIAQECRDIIDHWMIVNPYELVLVAKLPDATMPIFASTAVQSGIMSKKDFVSRAQKMPDLADVATPSLAGTAPWQYKSRSLNQSVLFEKVPYKHWRVDADFQELEIRLQNEVSARLAGLLSGELGMTLLTRDTRDTAVSRGMKLQQGTLANTAIFVEFMGSYVNNADDSASGYKYPNSPVMDPKVRRALSKAINRDELNKLFLGEGVPMYLRFHNEAVDQSGWNAEWQSRFADEYGYDPAAARQLLSDAGFSASKPLNLTIELSNGAPNVPEQDDVLEAIAEMWKNVGVQAELETLDRGAFTTKQRAFGFDAHVYLYGMGQPQNWVLDRVLTAHRQTRGNGFENFEFESAFLNMIKELDADKRADLWKQVGNLDYDLHTSVPLFWLKQEAVADPKVVSSFSYPGNTAFLFTLLWQVKAA